MNGDDMNEVLGFHGYASDASSQMDEATQFVVFVRGETVVADTPLWPDEGFQFDDSIRSFTRTDAVFVASRGPTIVELSRLRPNLSRHVRVGVALERIGP